MSLKHKIEEFLKHIGDGVGVSDPRVRNLMSDPDFKDYVLKSEIGCRVFRCKQNCGVWHSPLHSAAFKGKSEYVRELLDLGANVDSIQVVEDGRDKVTALHRAVQGKRSEVVQLLLESGANPDVKGSIQRWNIEDKTPLEMAKEKNEQKCVKVFEDFRTTSEVKILRIRLEKYEEETEKLRIKLVQEEEETEKLRIKLVQEEEEKQKLRIKLVQEEEEKQKLKNQLVQKVEEIRRLETEISHSARAKPLFSIQSTELKKGECLGRGGFGKVWKFKLDQTVALKECLDELKGNKLEAFKAELDIMFSVDHPNLVKCFGYCTIDEFGLGILMELCSGNLKELIKNGRKLTEQEIIAIMLQIGRGVDYLHENHKIHRDLKPENILVQSKKKEELKITDLHAENIADLQFKIGDFGFCRDVMDLNSHIMSALGTDYYTAPEIKEKQNHQLKSDGSGNYNVKYGASADIFSFGRIGQELLRFSSVPDQDAVLKSPCKELFDQCCKNIPSERPSSRDIFEILTLNFISLSIKS